MTKILFAPFSIIGGFVAGKIATTAFEQLWKLVDNHKSPEPDQRRAKWSKLIVALALEGAIFRAVRGIVDRASRELFHRATGAWPGQERPEPA